MATPDVIVFSTGYTSFLDTIHMTSEEKWVNKMAMICSLDDKGELKCMPLNTYLCTFWWLIYLQAGVKAEAYFYSKVTALQTTWAAWWVVYYQEAVVTH